MFCDGCMQIILSFRWNKSNGTSFWTNTVLCMAVRVLVMANLFVWFDREIGRLRGRVCIIFVFLMPDCDYGARALLL